MRTMAEAMEWHHGAATAFGDPAEPVCQLFFRWQENLAQYNGGELACGMHDGELTLLLGPVFPPLPMPVQAGAMRVKNVDKLEAYGADRIGPGLWSLEPSLNAEGLIHGFVVLYDVPDPAPWEQRILVVDA